jgi:RNA polymerase sigma-70 factor (ECF subfamily)
MSPEALARVASPRLAERPVPIPRIKRQPTMTPALRFLSRRVAGHRSTRLALLGDGELIALARDGNADAFGVIYQRHATAAFSVAHRVCGVRTIAEDVVQDAFLSLWRSRDRYDASRGELRGWLLGVVRNRAIDSLRRAAVHERRRASGEGLEESLEASERTETDVERREAANEVRAALGSLPSDQREAIELAYFDGLTHTQIASTLGVPVGTVKGRMRLGLLKLRKQVAGADDQLRLGSEVGS